MKLLSAMTTGIFITLLATLSPAQADVDEFHSTDFGPPKPASMNVRNYDVTPKAFYESAYRALVKRGWKVETNELTRLVGSRSRGSEQYKVEIRFANDVISVGFVSGFHHSTQRNWLKNLAADIKQEIKPLKRRTVVAPPAPAPVPSQ